jgi:hypothetical protein
MAARLQAHFAAVSGKVEVLRLLHTLGLAGALTSLDATGSTVAHYAAAGGHAHAITALHAELGCGVDDLTRPDAEGLTPAHRAAAKGSSAVLQALLEGGAGPASFWSVDSLGRLPVQLVASLSAESLTCVTVLRGALAHPSAPGLRSLQAKRQWLAWEFEHVVGRPNPGENQFAGASVSVPMWDQDREDLLSGLCARLGIDETSGEVAEGVVARPIGDVSFAGENAAGPGVRREWFEAVVGELVDVGTSPLSDVISNLTSSLLSNLTSSLLSLV